MELIKGIPDLLNRLAATVAEIEAVGREFLARNHSIADQAHQGDIVATLLARDPSIITTPLADRRRTVALALSRLKGACPLLFEPDWGPKYHARLVAAVTGNVDRESVLAGSHNAGTERRRREAYTLRLRLKAEGRPIPPPPAAYEA